MSRHIFKSMVNQIIDGFNYIPFPQMPWLIFREAKTLLGNHEMCDVLEPGWKSPQNMLERLSRALLFTALKWRSWALFSQFHPVNVGIQIFALFNTHHFLKLK